MHQSRVENGKFMERLAKDPAIGGRIAEYTGRSKVKTYIKDAVINRYAKEKTRPPDDLSKQLEPLVELPISKTNEARSRNLQLYRGKCGTLVVVACGRLLKWETALRKLLEYLGRNYKTIEDKKNPVVLALFLMTAGKQINEGDKQLLEQSLLAINVKVFFH